MEKAKLIPLILLLAVAGAGCTSSKTENSTGDSTVVTPVIPVTPTPPGGSGTDDPTILGYGTNSVQFVPVSYVEMNNYVATHPLNAPTNFKVTVDLTKDGSNLYSGQIHIMYDDNGYHYDGVFDSGNATNPELEYSPYNGSAGWKEHSYNFWMNGTVFTGYFQDAYGAIILVVDGTSTTNSGDGQGGEAMLSGSVWYRNFAQSQAPQGPMRKCWYITAGPYNCQSAIMASKSAANPYPSDTYKKLGTFSGLSRSQAFH